MHRTPLTSEERGRGQSRWVQGELRDAGRYLRSGHNSINRLEFVWAPVQAGVSNAQVWFLGSKAILFRRLYVLGTRLGELLQLKHCSRDNLKHGEIFFKALCGIKLDQLKAM